MYAVIFRAEINELDDEYVQMADQLRELATNQYGCAGFTSSSDGHTEIAISYWHDLDSIRSWKNDPQHITAQKLGKQKWYKNFRVQIVNILREYEQE